MNVLILNPPGKYLVAGTRWSSKIKDQKYSLKYYPFPVYMGYALAVLREAGLNTFFLDAIAEEKTRDEVYAYVNKIQPDIIFMETSPSSYKDDLITIKDFKLPVVAIGALATAYPNKCVQDGYQYAIVGEYDYTVRDLSFAILNQTDLPENVVSKDKTTYQRLNPVDINQLPYPARDLMPIHLYNEPIAKGKNVVLVSSRGCPLKCNYCTVPAFMGPKNYRLRDPIKVVDEMEHILGNYDCDELYFDDDNLTVNTEHVEKMCQEIIRRGLKIEWGCMGDAFIKPELFKIMAKAGCQMFKFGIEHHDPEVNSAIPKKIKLDNVSDIFKQGKKNKVRIHPTFMIGLPYSSSKKDDELIQYALSCKPDTLQFSVATPLPGTEMYDLCKEKGWLATDDWSCFDGAGRSVVNYPDYSWTQITKKHVHAWDKWQTHFLVKQPKTMMHHIYGQFRRRGVITLLKISLITIWENLKRIKLFRIIDNRFIYQRSKEDKEKLNVLIQGQEVQALKGERLLDIILKNNLNFEHHCGGNGRCMTCIVKVHGKQKNSLSQYSDREINLLSEAELQNNHRLSCQTYVHNEIKVEFIQ